MAFYWRFVRLRSPINAGRIDLVFRAVGSSLSARSLWRALHGERRGTGGSRLVSVLKRIRPVCRSFSRVSLLLAARQRAENGMARSETTVHGGYAAPRPKRRMGFIVVVCRTRDGRTSLSTERGKRINTRVRDVPRNPAPPVWAGSYFVFIFSFASKRSRLPAFYHHRPLPSPSQTTRRLNAFGKT